MKDHLTWSNFEGAAGGVPPQEAPRWKRRRGGVSFEVEDITNFLLVSEQRCHFKFRAEPATGGSLR